MDLSCRSTKSLLGVRWSPLPKFSLKAHVSIPLESSRGDIVVSEVGLQIRHFVLHQGGDLLQSVCQLHLLPTGIPVQGCANLGHREGG
ncbi:hypothetical protein FKM82_019080 [Ascaphus truei]